jgi:hypothetical protein
MSTPDAVVLARMKGLGRRHFSRTGSFQQRLIEVGRAFKWVKESLSRRRRVEKRKAQRSSTWVLIILAPRMTRLNAQGSGSSCPFRGSLPIPCHAFSGWSGSHCPKSECPQSSCILWRPMASGIGTQSGQYAHRHGWFCMVAHLYGLMKAAA